MLKVREAVEKEVKEKNLNETDAKKLLVTTIKVVSGFHYYCRLKFKPNSFHQYNRLPLSLLHTCVTL